MLNEQQKTTSMRSNVREALILVSRKPAVLAYHLGELKVSANREKLRRQRW
jgi:hypothetical protein